MNNSNNNIVILGHGIGVKFVIDSLLLYKNSEYKVSAIITHPFHLHKEDLEMMKNRKDIYGDCAYNIFNATDDYGIPVYESEDVNSTESIEIIRKINPKYIISIGCRNILKKEFLSIFKNKVFNVHPSLKIKYLMFILLHCRNIEVLRMIRG